MFYIKSNGTHPGVARCNHVIALSDNNWPNPKRRVVAYVPIDVDPAEAIAHYAIEHCDGYLGLLEYRAVDEMGRVVPPDRYYMTPYQVTHKGRSYWLHNGNLRYQPQD